MPQLDQVVEDLMTEAARRSGYTYKLGSGGRTPEEQAQKVAQGYSKTLNSKHLTGRGRDVMAYDERGNYITDGAHDAYKTLGAVFRERAPAGVRWGGDFKSFFDPSHFELSAAASAPALDPILARHAEPAGSPLDPILARHAEPDKPPPALGSEWATEGGQLVRRAPAYEWTDSGERMNYNEDVDEHYFRRGARRGEIELRGPAPPAGARFVRPANAPTDFEAGHWEGWNTQIGDALPPSVADLQDETIRVNAQQPGTATPRPTPARLPRLSARPDPATQQGRQERDARAQLEQQPGARTTFDLRLLRAGLIGRTPRRMTSAASRSGKARSIEASRLSSSRSGWSTTAQTFGLMT